MSNSPAYHCAMQQEAAVALIGKANTSYPKKLYREPFMWIAHSVPHSYQYVDQQRPRWAEASYSFEEQVLQ